MDETQYFIHVAGQSDATVHQQKSIQWKGDSKNRFTPKLLGSLISWINKIGSPMAGTTLVPLVHFIIHQMKLSKRTTHSCAVLAKCFSEINVQICFWFDYNTGLLRYVDSKKHFLQANYAERSMKKNLFMQS
jgi:hypothetical protein